MKFKFLCSLISYKKGHQLRFVSNYGKFMLISSEDCSLCHNFEKQLNNWNDRNGNILNYDLVPLKSDREIFEKFKYDQPVLLHGDKVVMKHYFKSNVLKKYLDTIDNLTD
uniref:Glutaredoxin-like protein n=1 Tax=Strongyloides papillosus TaxID=174720 RepID=A0A0N5C6E3_STREA